MGFLLDCGASSLVAMKKQGISPATISTILVTHLHGDHFAGIPFFILDAQFSKREAPLIIAGPPGIQARVRDTMEDLFPKSSETSQRFPITFVELLPSTPSQIGSLCITAEPVVHFCGAPPYALRVECAGQTIAYSAILSGPIRWSRLLLESTSSSARRISLKRRSGFTSTTNLWSSEKRVWTARGWFSPI